MTMTMVEFVKEIEMQRFLMGLGKYRFAEFLGMHYHTYESFVKQDRKMRSKNIFILLDFMKNRGKKISLLELY